ncbi:MAG: hypothetical protein P8078_04535 [bacterium]
MNNKKVKLLILMALLFISCQGDKSTENDNDSNNNNDIKTEISLITPYVNQSDMASINEAFSSDSTAPWGFEHRGIDFFPRGELKPFRAVCSGVIDELILWQLESTKNWQVSVRIHYNSIYDVNYAFEPVSPLQEDGELQLDNMTITLGQTVSQGDTIGYLHTPRNGAHVDFSLFENWNSVCPEPYFTPAARDSIIKLIQVAWPGAKMCY